MRQVATQAISKVDGISDVKGDRATKSVKFAAKDASAIKAAKAALSDAGFHGTFKVDGKDYQPTLPVKRKSTRLRK